MRLHEIRKATQDDIPRIVEITRQASVVRTSRTPGFLELPPLTEQEYRLRLQSSDFCYVATHELAVVGFLLSYPRSSLDLDLVAGPIATRLTGFDHNFVYLEQGAVRKEYRQRGLARTLISFCLEDAAKAGHLAAYSATSHRPIRNTSMIDVFNSSGFSNQEEISFDGLVFGLYAKTI